MTGSIWIVPSLSCFILVLEKKVCAFPSDPASHQLPGIFLFSFKLSSHFWLIHACDNGSTCIAF
jgi:hypothetical protein